MRQIWSIHMRDFYQGLKPGYGIPLPQLDEHLTVIDDGGNKQEVKVVAVNERENTFDAQTTGA